MSNFIKDPYSRDVIGAAIEVHRELGPGLMENAYERCLCHELKIRKIPFQYQKEIPVIYKGEPLDFKYRMDLVVGNKLVVELKAVDKMLPVFEAQLLTYLRLTKIRVGLLINFNTPVLKDGITRLVL